MGLSMGYGTLLSHKGWLQCQNSEYGGAIFSLVFPVKEDGQEQIQEENTANATANTKGI